MKILMVLTSHDRLGDRQEKTGFWLEEFASPYYAFMDAGAEVTLASPLGGSPPLDPRSDVAEAETEWTRRFKTDALAQAALASTVRLKDVSPDNFDALFYPGGHGPLWDLANDATSIALIQSMVDAGKPAAFVCHAPGVLRYVKTPEGVPLVNGKDVTGFSNTEEQAIGLDGVVPFLVEDMLVRHGGNYTKAADWEPHVVRYDNLITGQNPASSEPAAKAVLEKLNFFSVTGAIKAVPWRTAPGS